VGNNQLMHQKEARQRLPMRRLSAGLGLPRLAGRAKEAAGFAATLLGLTLFLGGAVAAQASENIVALTVHEKAGMLFKATARTLARSSDGGATWEKVNGPSLPKGGKIAALAVSAKDKDLLYLAGAGLGVMRSTNGGRSWEKQAEGLPNQNVSALTSHSDQADTVYAYLPGEGIFRSQDRGAGWRMTDRGPREPIRAFVHSDMPGSMETGWLFAASSNGVRRSMDCFCGWHKAGELAGEMKAVAYDPDEPMRVYASGKPGLFVSEDGGETWTSLKGPAASISALAVAPGQVLYAAAEGVLYRSRDRGKTWEKLNA
jgi:photosystem II stability/assembly factor-like uncharacterized protein